MGQEMGIINDVVRFFGDILGDTPVNTMIGLGALVALLHTGLRLAMNSPSFLRWIRSGSKPRITFSWAKNNERGDDEIDPRNWANGDSDRWCLMREQRKGDFLRLKFRKHLTIYRVTVSSDHTHGFPIKGAIEFLPTEGGAWEQADITEIDWGRVMTYESEDGTEARGIGFRVLEPRMEPKGEQSVAPAWSISRIEIITRRWLFLKRTVVLPWE